MIYILNTNLQNKKKVKKALLSIYGLGNALSNEICDQLGISDHLELDQLSTWQMDRLSRLIEQNYFIGGDVEACVRKNKERLVFISSYRGFRHNQGLPCRGQRTHGNSKTARKNHL
jgi:small subunit ribosomal protein S13